MSNTDTQLLAPSHRNLNLLRVTLAHIDSFTVPGAKRPNFLHIATSFLPPAAIPVVMLLERWTPSQVTAIAFDFGVLLCVTLLLRAQVYITKLGLRALSSDCALDSSRAGLIHSLEANVDFGILSGITCAILVFSAALDPTTPTRSVAIIGGGYLAGVVLICAIELAWHLSLFIRGDVNTGH